MLKKLLLILFISFAIKVNAQQSKIDSLTRALEQTEDKNQKGGLLIFLSRAKTPVSIDKARADAQQALAYYQEMGNVEGQVDAYLQFSGLFSREAKYKLALDVDSLAYSLSKKQNYKKGMAISLSNMGRNLQQVGDMQKAKKALLESSNMFKAAGLERETAEIKNRLGVLYRRMGDFKLSLKYFDEALEIANRFNLTNSMGNIYMNKANTLDESAYYDEAIKNHLESIKIREKLKDFRGLAQNYNNIANVYQHSGQYREALKYYQQARVLNENQKPVNKTSLALSYTNLANGYGAVKEYDSVEIFFKKAINIFNETGEKPGLALVYHDLGGYFLDRNAYTEALENLTKALELRTGSLLVNDEAATRNLIGVVLGKLNRPKEAENYLLQALALAKNNNTRLQEGIYRSLADHYTVVGDAEKANDYQSRYFNLKDSLLSESEIINMVKHKAGYDLEKKEIALQLSVREKQLDNLKLKNRNKTIALQGAGLGILGLLLGMGAINFRQKQKASRLLTLKNEKIETLIKELHHRVKNNLQVVSGLLSLQSNRLEDEVAREAMDAGRSRVDAMALIHQKLYMEKDLASVDIKAYLENLSDSLALSFGYADNAIHTEIDLLKNEIDVDRAIPIGLIVNELVTNAFKHAFTQSDNAKVKVKLNEKIAGSLLLEISDNGKGYVKSEKQNHSFGMKLVQTLVEQLNGSLQQIQNEGTAYQIEINLAA